MTTKPETVFAQIAELPNHHNLPLLDFKEWLIEEEDSTKVNAANYLRVLKLFSPDIGDKKFKDVEKEDVLAFLNKRKKSIEDDPEKKWVRTWNDYLARLVGFYRWLTNHEQDISKDDWKTPKPFCDIKKKKDTRESSYSPNDVWELDELLLVVKYCPSVRNKCILTMMWDLVHRNHEIVKVRIRDIVMKEKYAEVSTAYDTKTGIRTNPIIVGFPYLRDLLNIHPFSSNPNSFLVVSETTMKPITADHLWTITDTLKKRISKMIIENTKDDDGKPIISAEDREKLIKLLKKPWNPYLLGRHSSLTEKTDQLVGYQLNQYAGWTINSTRPKTYIHRKGKQVINPLLQSHGIEEKPKPKIIRRDCTKCGFINTVESTICSQCSFVLNSSGWEQTKIEEQQKEKDMNLKMSALESSNENLQNELDDIKNTLADLREQKLKSNNV